MNIAGIRYERFSPKDERAVKEALSRDADAGEDILRVLAEEPELFVVSYIGDKLVGLAQVNEPVSQSYLTVFVAPEDRRQGIGSAMVRYAEAKLRAGGTQIVRSSFRAGHPCSLRLRASSVLSPTFHRRSCSAPEPLFHWKNFR